MERSLDFFNEGLDNIGFGFANMKHEGYTNDQIIETARDIITGLQMFISDCLIEEEAENGQEQSETGIGEVE